MTKLTLIVTAISCALCFSDITFMKNKSHQQEQCSLLDKKCDWSLVFKNNNDNIPSDLYHDSKNDIICINTGEWPEYSRAPCDIGYSKEGIVKKIFVDKCKPSLKNNNKLICKFELQFYDNYIKRRVTIDNGKLLCSCNKYNPGEIIPDSCKVSIEAKFKVDGADLGLSCYLLIFIVFVCIIPCLCYDDSSYSGETYFFPVFLGDSTDSFDDNNLTIFGETD